MRTDFRAPEDRGVNLMVSHSCAMLLRTGETTPLLARQVEDELPSVINPRTSVTSD